MGLHGVLPTEGGAFPLGNCRGGDLDEVGILKQLGVGGENRRFRLLSMAMKLSTQGFELPGRLVYGIIEQPPLLAGRAPLFLHLDLHMAHLVHIANRQSGRCRDTCDKLRIGILPRSRSRDRRHSHRRRRGNGNTALVAESFCDHWGKPVHCLTGVRTLGQEHDLVASRCLQRHQGCDAASVRRTVAELQSDIALERLCRAA
jgi:hypothetical protein